MLYLRSDGAITIRLLTELKPETQTEMTALYRAAGWIAPEESGDFLPAAVSGALLCAGAFTQDGRLIASGRVLSDGVSDAFLQDIAVAPEFRKQGIGGAIVRFLIAETQKRGIDWIGLVGEPGTEKFYAGLGLTLQKNYTLWKL